MIPDKISNFSNNRYSSNESKYQMSNSTSDMSYFMGKVFIHSLTQNLNQQRD